MGFSEKIKVFFEGKGLKTNLDIAKALDINNDVVGRWMKSNKPTTLFLERLKFYFPDAPLGYLLSDDTIKTDMVEEDVSDYGDEAQKLVLEIEERLLKLKAILARNCHEK